MKSFREWLLEAIMDPKTALKIFGLAEFPKTPDELRQLHRKLALSNHPDRGGSLKKMQDINAANDVLKNWIGKSVKTVAGSTASRRSAETRRKKQTSKPADDTFKNATKTNFDDVDLDKNRMKTYGPIYEKILEYFNQLQADKFCKYISSILGQKFSWFVRSKTMKDIINITDNKKSPWMTWHFVNEDKSLCILVELYGDTNHQAYRLRDTDVGFNRKKDFVFEWMAGVSWFKNGNVTGKKPLTKKSRHQRANVAFLTDPSKLLPEAKLKTLI